MLRIVWAAYENTLKYINIQNTIQSKKKKN